VDDGQRKTGGNSGVDGIPARAQHVESNARSQRMRRDHHAMFGNGRSIRRVIAD
jgi:hypothetical protein